MKEIETLIKNPSESQLLAIKRYNALFQLIKMIDRKVYIKIKLLLTLEPEYKPENEDEYLSKSNEYRRWRNHIYLSILNFYDAKRIHTYVHGLLNMCALNNVITDGEYYLIYDDLQIYGMVLLEILGKNWTNKDLKIALKLIKELIDGK